MNFEVALPAIKVAMNSAMFRKSAPKNKFKFVDGELFSNMSSENWIKLKGNCFFTVNDVLADDWQIENIKEQYGLEILYKISIKQFVIKFDKTYIVWYTWG